MVDRKEQLTAIVGSENVFDDVEILEAYSRDESFTTPRKPHFVIKPGTAGEVQKIVQWANETLTPLVPVSSGPPRFRGDTVPGLPGVVVVDLSRMKRIIRIDRRNKVTMVEPGVTYGELQPELAKVGLRLTTPLLPRRSKSVVASLLEREPILVPKYQWALPDPLACLEVVWGNGEIFRTGEAGVYATLEEQWKMHLAQICPMGPGQLDYYRLVQAAQGSMGIVTWASIECEILPQRHKLFLAQSNKLENLLGFAYKLLEMRYGDELLFLNNSNLACILGEDADQVRALREGLPRWVLMVGVAGRDMLPEERVAYQVKDIADFAQGTGVQCVPAIAEMSGKALLETLLKPSSEPYWKLRYKGGCQDIFFMTTLDRVSQFVERVYTLAQSQEYPSSDIGIYVQPVQQGVSCHCEFNLPFNPANQNEKKRIQRLLTEGSASLMNMGAFFSRPYGPWADMVYKRDAQTATVLKKVKGLFDPNNVMNPGKLCFDNVK